MPTGIEERSVRVSGYGRFSARRELRQLAYELTGTLSSKPGGSVLWSRR